jgi:hypothetical protein
MGLPKKYPQESIKAMKLDNKDFVDDLLSYFDLTMIKLGMFNMVTTTWKKTQFSDLLWFSEHRFRSLSHLLSLVILCIVCTMDHSIYK